jgi:hypothetical protein
MKPPFSKHVNPLPALPRPTTWRVKAPAWWSNGGLGGNLAVHKIRLNPLQLKEKGNYLAVEGRERRGVMQWTLS